MAIRSAVKAVIIKEGRLLLNVCHSGYLGEYFDLPGGGMNEKEPMADALRRECLEETGFAVEVGRFLALGEEIYHIRALEERYPNHVHRIYHIFECFATDDAPLHPTETDAGQTGSRWVPLADVANLNMYPHGLRAILLDVLQDGIPRYLGTAHIRE